MASARAIVDHIVELVADGHAPHAVAAKVYLQHGRAKMKKTPEDKAAERAERAVKKAIVAAGKARARAEKRHASDAKKRAKAQAKKKRK